MAQQLLKTKFHLAAPREDVVRRPRLTKLIDRGLRGRLTLIAAPAGSGKSTLVSDWQEAADGQGHTFAWLSLDDADNDPVRFFTYFAAALEGIQPGIGEVAASLFGASNLGAGPDEILTTLINEMSDIDDDFVLGLDDYHVITSEQIHGMMSTLVENMPPRMHLLITSRHDPPIPLARLRARGDLTEIRAADLQFDGDEAATMLAAAEELELPASVLSDLTERTEGWAAGLHLFALSVRGSDLSDDELRRRVESFSGGQNFVFDYLATEIFEQCDEQLREFLVKTSLLDHLNGPLCDHVTGMTNGERTLANLAEQNLFLIPLDDERRWYRYHHLFQDFLRSRALEPGADIAQEVHHLAAAWLENNGLKSEAIEQAYVAGDHEGIARLLVANIEVFESTGHSGSMARWANALPDEMVRTRPRLALTYAMATMATEDNNENARKLYSWAEDSLKAIEARGVFRPADDVGGTVVGIDGLDSLNGELLALKLIGTVKELSLDEITTVAGRALELIPATKFRVRGMIHILESGFQMDLGNVEAALMILEKGVEEAHHAQDRSLLDGFFLFRGQVNMAMGRLDDARLQFEDSLSRGQDDSGEGMWMMSASHIGLAEIFLEHGDLAEASSHAELALTALTRAPMRRFVLFGHTISAQVFSATGDIDSALLQLEQAQEYARGARRFRHSGFLTAVRINIYCGNGDLESAGSIIRERSLSPDTPVEYQNEEEMTAYARYLIARDSYSDAAQVLSAVLPVVRNGGRVQHEIHALALNAIAHELLGERALALESLGRATQLGEPGRFCRTFTAEGPVMAALLNALTDAVRRGRGPEEVGSTPYLVFLLSEMGSMPDAATASTPAAIASSRSQPQTLGDSVNASLPEPLSDREIEVIGLIASGASNQQIAEQLVVSLSTVKTHINRTYRKLDARSRTQAVAVARQLGLV